MKNSIYKILYKKRNRKIFRDSDEILFYKRNNYILKDNNYFSRYLDIDNIFDIIKANIIIKSIINKEKIEKNIEREFFINKNFNSLEVIKKNITSFYDNLPFLELENKQKIFVPFFNESINYIYQNNYELIEEEPYNLLKKKYSIFIIDPFEIYKDKLFDSDFTNLIRINENDSSIAFFHYSLNTIFFISKQGYLDNFLVLFDKYLKNPNKSKIIERVKNSVSFYYKNNHQNFLYSLYDNKLISPYIYNKLCKIKKN